MNFLNRLEKKLGKYAIPHLTRYIIVAYAVGYILAAISSVGNNAGVLEYLTLSPSMILRGQIWRIVSWVLIPPSQLSIFTVFMLFFYYSIGTQLERAWGDFLYNVFVFTGLILTIIGSFVLYAITRPVDYGAMFSTYYVSMSLILGFSMTYPDHMVLFYFFIPLKMKWLALIDLAFLAYTVFQYSRVGLFLPAIVMVGCSLANALIFFLLMRKNKRRARTTTQWGRNAGGSPFGGFGGGRTQQGPYGSWGNAQRPGGAQQGQRPGGTQQWGQRPGGQNGNAGNGWGTYGQGPGNTGSAQNTGAQPRHRCAICGRTELDNPNLEFRYCTKCHGYYEYCQDHLFTHTHK